MPTLRSRTVPTQVTCYDTGHVVQSLCILLVVCGTHVTPPWKDLKINTSHRKDLQPSAYDNSSIFAQAD